MLQPALYPLLLFKVGEKQKAARIDAFIAGQHKNYSRSKLKALCDAGRLLVNNQVVKASYIVKPNDSIALLTPYATQGDKLAPQNIPIEILFEDEHLIVVNKAAGMAVHPGLGDYNNTLVNALNFHLNKNFTGSGNRQILVAHRLDKHTSGAIVFAKTQKALEHLSQQFVNHSIERIYYALVCGIPSLKEGRIETFMGRNPNNEKDIGVSEDKIFGKNAITNYKVKEEFAGKAALVQCMLETGRTHQIRIHMHYLGHALINDQRYPNQAGRISEQLKEACFKIQPYQALHAQCLGFKHPETGAQLFFDCHFPAPYIKLLEYLETLV